MRTLFYHKWDEHNFLFCVILFFYDLSFIVEGQRDYCVIVVVTTFILFLNNFLVSLLCNTTFFMIFLMVFILVPLNHVYDCENERRQFSLKDFYCYGYRRILCSDKLFNWMENKNEIFDGFFRNECLTSRINLGESMSGHGIALWLVEKAVAKLGQRTLQFSVVPFIS